MTTKPGVDEHAHKCNSCGHFWVHADSCQGDRQSHVCAECGDVQWAKHYSSFAEMVDAAVNAVSKSIDRAAKEFVDEYDRTASS